MTSISDTEVVNAPGGLVELGYSVAPDTTVTATTIGSAHQLGSITFVSDGSPVLVEFSAGVVSPPTNNSSLVFVALEVDGSTTNRIYWISFRNSASAGNYLDQSAYAQERLVLSAGTHTIRTLAWCSGGTNGVVHSGGNYSPAITRVSKIIQASQLLVTQSNAPIVTSLPSGNLVTGQEVDLYVTSPYAGYQRHKWNGSAWYVIGDSRANTSWQTYNPIFKQGASTISSTISYARYMVMGKTCFVRTRIVASGAGTAPNIISTTVPIAPLNAGYVNGIFVFSDVNPGVNYAALTPIVGSDLVVYGYGFQRGNGFGADPSLAVASGDVIEIALTYEVA